MDSFPIHTTRLTSLLAALSIAAAGCAETGEDMQMEEGPDATEPDIGVETPPEAADGPAISAERGAPVLTAILSPTEDSDVRGTVTFIPDSGGTRVTAAVRGLSPGEHGFHIHEEGDCSGPEASSAEGHYAPDGSPHGAPTDPEGERHMGDLGNLEAGDDGVAEYDRVDRVIEVRDPDDSILGQAVIVHEGRDDLASQPSGDAGPRQACGVITIQGSTGVVGSDRDGN